MRFKIYPSFIAGCLIAHAAHAAPNILLVLTDDQRFDAVGFEHSPDGLTAVMPNVDRMLGLAKVHGIRGGSTEFAAFF